MNPTVKPVLFWVALLLTAVLLYQLFQLRVNSQYTQWSFSRFLDEIQKGNLKDVTIVGSETHVSEVTGHLNGDDAIFKTFAPAEYPQMIDMLRDKKIQIIVERSSQAPWLPGLIAWAFPIVFVVGFSRFLVRQMRPQ
jgi:cell division protease FtsH